jgi:DNA-directed RNA polymerase specialized sigma subunit
MKGKKPSLKVLREAYETYGGKSPEFLEAVRGLIIFVMWRYTGFYSEDLFQIAYQRVLESFAYYDSTRANIATFIFAVVRNRASNYLYHTGKRLFESADSLPYLESDDNAIAELEDTLDCEASLKKLKRIRVIGDKREVTEFCKQAGEDSFHYRFLIWNAAGE